MLDALMPGFAALQNVHPMFVHFPIAFFLGALAMELLAVLYAERFHLVATWMLYWGALAAIVTATTGYAAMNSLAENRAAGHAAPGHDYIHIHRNWMISVTLFASVLGGYLLWLNRKDRWATHRWGLLLGLFVLAVLVTLGADRGARLVYEFGAGVNPKLFKDRPVETGHDNGH